MQTLPTGTRLGNSFRKESAGPKVYIPTGPEGEAGAGVSPALLPSAPSPTGRMWAMLRELERLPAWQLGCSAGPINWGTGQGAKES